MKTRTIKKQSARRIRAQARDEKKGNDYHAQHQLRIWRDAVKLIPGLGPFPSGPMAPH